MQYIRRYVNCKCDMVLTLHGYTLQRQRIIYVLCTHDDNWHPLKNMYKITCIE